MLQLPYTTTPCSAYHSVFLMVTTALYYNSLFSLSLSPIQGYDFLIPKFVVCLMIRPVKGYFTQIQYNNFLFFILTFMYLELHLNWLSVWLIISPVKSYTYISQCYTSPIL